MAMLTDAEFNYQRVSDMYKHQTFLEVFFNRREVQIACKNYFNEHPIKAKNIFDDVEKNMLKKMVYKIGFVSEFNRQRYNAANEFLDNYRFFL